MFPYTPVAAQIRPPSPSIGRVVAQALGQGEPPPGPDTIFTGYTGMSGLVETFAVIAISGAAAWVGVRTGMGQGSRVMKAAGWVGGVGSALLGLLYLGGRTGYSFGLPAVRVTPA